MSTFTSYTITSSAGINLGTFDARSEDDALDALARDAGYIDSDHAARVCGPWDVTYQEHRVTTEEAEIRD